MINWLLHNWKGFVRLRLHGYSPERFLNLCSARGLELWGIECGPDGDYSFYMTAADFFKVRPLVRKSRVRLRVTGRFGLPFFIWRNRGRWYYGAGLAGFFTLLYCMSLFIWDIQFEGNCHYTQDTLMDYLKTQEIGCGMKKSGVDCEKLEAELRMDFPEITWVSARVSGTRLLIHIKENDVLSEVTPDNEEPCDLIASKSGTITSMVVRQGVAQVQAGDIVEKGQVLVKGRISITDDSEEEVRGYLVTADGDIRARTTEIFETEVKRLKNLRTPTGRTRRGWYLKAGPWSFQLLVPVPGSRQWDYVMEERQLRLFSDFYLPVYIGQIRGNEVSVSEGSYTEEELLSHLDAMAEGFEKKLTEKGVQILENNDRIEESVSGYRLIREYVVEESIVATQPPEEPVTEPKEIETAQ